MAGIDAATIFVPPVCSIEHRRAAHRFTVFLPHNLTDEEGKRSRSYSYGVGAADDSVSANSGTQKLTALRAYLKAAAWACRYISNHYQGVPDEWVEPMLTCMGVELSLTPMTEW